MGQKKTAWRKINPICLAQKHQECASKVACIPKALLCGMAHRERACNTCRQVLQWELLCYTSQQQAENMLTLVVVNNSQQLHGNVKFQAITNAKHAATQIKHVRFRNYFTTVLKSSTWSTESIWVFRSETTLFNFRLNGSSRIVGNLIQTMAIWTHTEIQKRVIFERWPCLCQTSFFTMEPDTVRVDLWEHLVLLLLFIISYNIFQQNLSEIFLGCNNSMQIYTQCLKHTSNSLSYSRRQKMDLAVLNNMV